MDGDCHPNGGSQTYLRHKLRWLPHWDAAPHVGHEITGWDGWILNCWLVLTGAIEFAIGRMADPTCDSTILEQMKFCPSAVRPPPPGIRLISL